MVIVISLVTGVALLFIGADRLVRSSASVALRLGLTRLVAGLTIVAFGTSMPELFVSTQAALERHGDISLGNVVGSNIFNLLCIGCSTRILVIILKNECELLDFPYFLALKRSHVWQ